MKKQIIAIASVAVAAIILFVVYSVFFDDDGIDVSADPFYTVSGESAVSETLEALDNKYVLRLRGYDVDDDGWIMLLRFANEFANASKKISVDASEGGAYKGVTVEGNGKSEDIAYDSFFLKLYDGTVYACDAQSLIVNAIRKCEGLPETGEIAPRAFSGYDSDGDTVTATGMPFLFPALDRSDIAYLTLHNATGSYTLYQENGSFYYGSSRAVQYDAEQFSLLTTNCRYVVTYGKMDLPADKDWADYGLEVKDPATANYSIMTLPDVNGNYTLHSVYIGKKSSTGEYYFGRYTGGVFEYGEENSSLIANLTKDKIYFIPVSVVEGSLDSSADKMLSTALVTAVTSTSDLLSLQDVHIDFYDEDIHALVKNMSAFNAAGNLTMNASTSLSKTVSDKKTASAYSSYDGGWREHTDVFAGFTSTDGKGTYIEAALARYADNGRYTVTFGVLRDESQGAYLPAKFTVYSSYDGVNYSQVGEPIVPSQNNGELRRYELTLESEEHVRFVRIAFDVPQVAQSYVVFDEIRIYSGDEDAQPTDSISGIWRLVSPGDYIASGRNFAYLDMNNFNNFVQELAALSGESVAHCGISDNGDATKLKEDVLDEYGLLNPYRHFSFTLNGATADFYFSKPDENGVCYAYSTVSGDYNGTYVKLTGDIIVTVPVASAEWLGWDFFEFLDHSLVDMYIVEIEEMDVSFDGDDYKFILTTDEARSDLLDVSCNGQSHDVLGFKYLYQYMLSIYLQDEYIPGPDEQPEEYLRIKIVSETRSPEIVFYRVSATKCYFTIDGEGSYYALAKSVNAVRDNLLAYLNGEEISRPN